MLTKLEQKVYAAYLLHCTKYDERAGIDKWAQPATEATQ